MCAYHKVGELLREALEALEVMKRKDRIYRVFLDTFGVPPDRVELRLNTVIAVREVPEKDIMGNIDLFDPLVMIAHSFLKCRHPKFKRIKLVAREEPEVKSKELGVSGLKGKEENHYTIIITKVEDWIEKRIEVEVECREGREHAVVH